MEKDDPRWQELIDCIPALKHWCLGRGMSDADADDLVEDTILRAATNIEQFDRSRGTKLRSWLFGIVRRGASTIVRKESGRRRLLKSKYLPLLEKYGADGYYAELSRQPPEPELVECLWACVAELREDHRRVVMLHYSEEELSNAEIAVRVGKSEDSVRSSLYRAHKRLANLFEEKGC